MPSGNEVRRSLERFATASRMEKRVFVDNLNEAHLSRLRSPGDATEADPNYVRGNLGTQRPCRRSPGVALRVSQYPSHPWHDARSRSDRVHPTATNIYLSRNVEYRVMAINQVSMASEVPCSLCSFAFRTQRSSWNSTASTIRQIVIREPRAAAFQKNVISTFLSRQE